MTQYIHILSLGFTCGMFYNPGQKNIKLIIQFPSMKNHIKSRKAKGLRNFYDSYLRINLALTKGLSINDVMPLRIFYDNFTCTGRDESKTIKICVTSFINGP